MTTERLANRNNSLGIIVLLTFLLNAASFALQEQAKALPPWLLPSPYPDRVILTFSGDPATSQAVTWRTDTSVTNALAQIVPAQAGPQFAQQAQTIKATTTRLTTDLGAAHYHSAVFTNLKPNSLYAYRVGDGNNWSEWFHFRTASDREEPFTFLYFADAQNDIRSHCPRVFRQAFQDAPKARFLLHAGDLINRANSDAEWGEWFYTLGWLGATIPSVPTPGNHEYARNEDGKRLLTAHWRAQFTLPENGVPGLEETAYFIKYQGALIISLNCMEKLAEQAEWLEKVLRENPSRWTIVTFHFPILSSAQGRDNPRLRAIWKPIFDNHRVDLVLQGHDHTYARSVQQEGGTVYVVSVAGPKMYRLNPQPWMKRSAENTQLYQVIRVERDKIVYEARTATGELYDAFELHKREGQTNKLVELTPKRR